MFSVTKPQQHVDAASQTDYVVTATANTTKNFDSVATRRVCRVCLAMGVKMYQMSEHKLSVMYERVTGVVINSEDKLPKMICWECAARLSSANNFVVKALKTLWILLNTTSGDNITMSDVASIDRAHHRLKSTLGFKHYEVNITDLHIQRESDITSDDCAASNVELLINDYEDSSLQGVETFTIKSELIDIKEQPEEADLQIPNPIIVIKENESDEGGTVEDVSTPSEKSGDEDSVVHKDREFCEATNQERKDLSASPLSYRSNGLTFNKELRVVLEDVMLTLGKQNTQDFFREATNNNVFYFKDQSVKNKEIGTHPTINKRSLTSCNNMDTDSVSTNEAPKNTNKKVCTRTSTVTCNDAESSKRDFICDICNKSYQQRKPLYKHIQRHLNLFVCTYCSYPGHTKDDLNRHMNTKHNENTAYRCSYCSYSTYKKSTLSSHVNSKHTKSTVYNCSYCSYSTCLKSTLSSHVNSKHTKNTVYYCSYCSYSTCLKSTLNRHVNSIHNKNIVYNCSYCSYSTCDRSNLKSHVITKHTENTAYSCSYCSYSTCDRNTLSSHVNTKHTMNTVYNCTHCSYTTYKKSTLSSHVYNKHTQNTVYNCSYCSYRTCVRSTLSRHVNSIHTKNIVYNCSYCSYSTYNRSSLCNHVNSKHTKKTVHNCSYCDYKSFHKGDLNHHVNAIHTKINVYYCSYCDHKTYHKNTLAKHINSKHTKNTVLKCSL